MGERFVEAGCINILLVPVQPIRRSRFDEFAELIRRWSTIPLADVAPDTRGDRAVCSSGNGEGKLLFHYLTPASYAALHPLAFLGELQLHRRIQGIIGVLDLQEYNETTIADGQRAFANSLRELPKTFITKIYAFNATSNFVGTDSDNVVFIPSSGDVGFFLSTLLADLASNILWEFSNIAAQLESRPTIPTPQETVSTPFSYFSKQPTETWTTTTPGSPAQPPSADAVLVDHRAKKRVLGRERKIMGDIWLLSGRLSEAIEAYNEALLSTKSLQDSIWHASAIEGLVTALALQAASPTKPRTTPVVSAGATPPPVLDGHALLTYIPERMLQAVTLYTKMLPSINHESLYLDPDRCHPLIYTEACLRSARFLYTAWLSNDDMNVAIKNLSDPSYIEDNQGLSPAEISRNARLRGYGHNPVTRQSISSWVNLAYGPHLLSLSLPLRLRLLGEIADFYGKIGYIRKESFALREIAALCAEGVVGKGIEILTAKEHAPAPSIIEENPDIVEDDLFSGDLGTLPKIPTSKSTDVANDRGGGSIVRTTADTAGNQSITWIVERVCNAFGISVISKEQKKKNDIKSKRMSVMQGRTVQIQESTQGHFGWPTLQFGVLCDAIAIAEALPDYQAAIRFTVTALRSLAESMPPMEQYRLSQNIPRIFAAATRHGVAFNLDYWGPTQLVISLEVAPVSTNRMPYEQVYEDEESLNNVDGSKAKNPFIYTPTSGHSPSFARPMIVQEETVEVFVTLQNPFLFALEIQNIELSTAGVPFQSDLVSATVPAGSFHTVRLSGKPLKDGLLIVRGCNIHLEGCLTREFLLPIWSDQEETKRQKAASLNMTKNRIKKSGLEANFGNGVPAMEEGCRFLECTVVPNCPLLWIRSTSLTHGSLMLYDGETSTIRVGLENPSSSPVDFVTLSFTDNHTASNQTYIAENDLHPGDVYEIDYDSTHRPVFKWTEQEVYIAPNGSAVFDIQCLGKVGCTQGTIHIDYAYVNQAAITAGGKFYTRRVSLDVHMTVHKPLVAHSLEVLRLSSLPTSFSEVLRSHHARTPSIASMGRNDVELDKDLETSLKNVVDGKHCLVCVDIVNNYSQPFEVTLSKDAQAARMSKAKQRLEPGATTRLLARMDRITLPAEKITLPIPSIVETQFVLPKSQTSPEAESQMRELFWYREELFNRLYAHWNEVGSLRSGTISLRNLRLSKPMLDIFRGEEVNIQMSLSNAFDANDTDNLGNGRERKEGKGWIAAIDEFVNVTIIITNHTLAKLNLETYFFLYSAPGTPTSHYTHLLRYVVINGVPSRTLDPLEPGEKATVSIPLCLLAKGNFVFGCEAKDLNKTESRKVYKAKELLEIVVDR